MNKNGTCIDFYAFLIMVRLQFAPALQEASPPVPDGRVREGGDCVVEVQITEPDQTTRRKLHTFA